jgi:hypothetical protein
MGGCGTFGFGARTHRHEAVRWGDGGKHCRVALSQPPHPPPQHQSGVSGREKVGEIEASEIDWQRVHTAVLRLARLLCGVRMAVVLQ